MLGMLFSRRDFPGLGREIFSYISNVTEGNE